MNPSEHKLFNFKNARVPNKDVTKLFRQEGKINKI